MDREMANGTRTPPDPYPTRTLCSVPASVSIVDGERRYEGRMTSGCYKNSKCYGVHSLQLLLVFLWVVFSLVDGFRIGGVPALQQQHLNMLLRRRDPTRIYSTYSHSDSDNYSVGGGGQEGFHYLSTDVPPDFRNSLQGDGPDGHRVRSTASFARQGEQLLDFIYNNHSEAEQIRAAEERMLQPFLNAEAIARLTPPLLGPPEEQPAEAQQQYALPPPTEADQQQQQQQQLQPPLQAEEHAAVLDQPSTATQQAYGEQQQQEPANAQADEQAAQPAAAASAAAGDVAGSATATTTTTTTTNNDDSPKPPLSARLSWTPSALHDKPLWYDLQSEPQRNSQLQAELRRAFQELQHYHTLLLEYEQDLDAAAAHQAATESDLAESHAQLAASQETIAQLRYDISALQQQVHDGKAVELEYVKREVAYLQQQQGENSASALATTTQDAVLTQLRNDMAVLQQQVQESKARELAHAKEQHQQELEVVRQQGYQSAVNKVHHWGQRITKLENELQQLHAGVVGSNGSSASPAAAATQALPQLQASQASQRPWSTMPGAKFNTDGVVYDSAYDTRTTD